MTKQVDSSMTRNQGKTIDMQAEEAVVTVSREAKIFMPDLDNDLSKVPASISAEDVVDDTYRGLTLEALPIKGLKSFVIGIASIFGVMSLWQIYTVFQSALALHWIAAAGFSGLIIIVAMLALRSVFSFMADKENMAALAGLQDKAEQLKMTNDVGQAKGFIAKFTQFYKGKPQAPLLAKSIKTMPDYSSDKEAMVHLEHVFLAPLDKEALRRVSKHSLQTGVVVAASPWAAVDMLLALWRSMKMIDEVGQVYGMRPSLANRYKLLKSVLRYLALIGVSELALDEMLQEFGTTSLAGITGARLSQGVGAGVYTARIGLAAITACRPISFSPENKPKLKDFIKRIIQRMNG
ncbi:Membrane protein YcjF [Moritella sp. JT01]|uniref:TIGR01620 family protein n=1 Tax=Moritella sp. JT01 TaxID=756698 RepID=UPI000796D140|nr:TIGR01620 family protein [Moritella sp. JT01]KXO10127.1 Membrane protein YcjF [Moritella sp. JT01]